MVGGTASRSTSPLSRTMATISSTKSAFPPDASVIRARASVPRSRSPSRFPINVSQSSSRSGSRRSDVALSFPPPQSGRASRSSFRATQSRKIGASRERSATCSTRSTNSGSAHCRSSITATCGRSAARASSSLRNATLVSAGEEATTLSGSISRGTSISTSGQYVMPSPYERHRPRRTSASAPTRSRKSATRRDFPMPAGPRRVKSWHVRSATASSKARQSLRRSRSRPTSGAVRLRAIGGASSTTSSRRNASTGRDFPFSSSGSSASAWTASRTSASVSAPTRISPFGAACSRRAATLTASPVTRVSPSPPTTTSPLLIPIRASNSCAAIASRISAAARTARSASSSCETGMPKTAITASPTNFSTDPPWRSMIARRSSKYRRMRARSASGSVDSPSAVEPTRSQKRIVTTLRCSRMR